MRPVEEQVILVTGSTDGLGRALAQDLAARGATVLLHGRGATRGETAVREISEATGSDRLAFYRADLSSLEQVRALAEAIAGHERLDVLVNNAGIGASGPTGAGRELSQDGHELRFAVNYLAPFLVTHLLEPLLVRSAPARIVNVSSAGQAPIDFADVMLEHGYSGVQAYSQSKLALVMLTFDLAGELRDRGVTANCLHPGTFMPTKMVLEAGISPVDTLASGVEATSRLAVAPELDNVTGKYFVRLQEGRADSQAYDADARRRLRELSADLVGLATTTTERLTGPPTK
jgi:NAD(P)-dependent dehydrogenase (short-subunit alcohol dehydrogenase family)